MDEGKQTPYVSIIIPAYNEENIIENTINQIAEYLYRLFSSGQPFQIVVVNDGSTDRTAEILNQLAQERAYLQVVHHQRNKGRGMGLRSGFEASRGRFVFSLDADLSYAPDQIGSLLKPLEHEEADIVLASAYHSEGSVSNVPLFRRLVSRFGNRLISMALGGEFKTVTCIVRGYRREVVENLVLFSDDKAIHLEIIQKARILGYKIIEVPADLVWRNDKRSSGKKGLNLSSFRQLAVRHLFFNFLFRPSMISWIPVGAVGAVFLAVSVTSLLGFSAVLSQHPLDAGWLRFYYALREHMLAAKVSYFVWSLSLLLLFQFFSLLFIAKQSSHHYEELFSFLSLLHKRIKKLEKRTD